MKRKLVAIGLCLVMSVAMLACGSTMETSVDLPDTNIEEVQDSMNVPEEENVETAQEIPEEVVEDNPENWTDDMVIPFTDSDMEECVRNLTGIQDRDITYGDVKNITEFSNGPVYTISDITSIKYFTSLVHLSIVGGAKNTNLDMLKNLSNLEELVIDGWDNLTDISDLPSLTSLEVYSCDKLTGISNLPCLTELTIFDCEDLSYVGGLADLPNLKELTISPDCIIPEILYNYMRHAGITINRD